MFTLPTLGSLLGGKYRIDRLLGEGGMGAVFEATHVALRQRVAVKVLKLGANPSEQLVARFMREARVAATLPSAHVVRVTDVGESPEAGPYLVMELLDGVDLAAELDACGRFGLQDAVDYVLQACTGLAEAHAAGLVHRDLKPSNLFLARSRAGTPTVKVLDFGLTKVPSGDGATLTASGEIFGTPAYMAPEQIDGAAEVDARADQHAMAAILFEFLTGVRPFAAPTVAAEMVRVATLPAPSVRAADPNLPVEIDAALQLALAKRPDDRFPNLASFAEALEPFGGLAAKARVAEIRAALGPSPAPMPRPARAIGDLSTEARSAVDSLLSHTSTHRIERRPSRPRALGAAIALLAVLAAAAAAMWVGPFRRGADVAASVPSSASARPNPLAESPTHTDGPAAAQAAASAAGAAEPAPTTGSSAAQAQATASGTTRPKKGDPSTNAMRPAAASSTPRAAPTTAPSSTPTPPTTPTAPTQPTRPTRPTSDVWGQH